MANNSYRGAARVDLSGYTPAERQKLAQAFRRAGRQYRRDQRVRNAWNRAMLRAARVYNANHNLAVTRPGAAGEEQREFRGLALHCPATSPKRLELPFVPDEITQDNLADTWDTVARPGRDPLLYRAGGRNPKLSFGVELYDERGVGPMLSTLKDMAGASTPVVVSLSRHKWQAMRITGLAVSATEWLHSGEVKRATVDLEFTRETTVAAAPGPVKISKRKEKKIKADQAAKRRERKAANDKDNQHRDQPKQSGGAPKLPNRHQTPEQAKQWARWYISQQHPHWGDEHWQAIVWIFNKESGWRWNAQNPTSPAYGIPQSLPGSKMAAAGSDWHDNAFTQIKWGINYMIQRYGGPLQAKAAWVRQGWY